MPAIRLCRPVPQQDASTRKLSPRRTDLAGLHLGLVGNSKPNADVMLRTVAEMLVARGAAGYVLREKENYSFAAPHEIIDEIARTCQAAFVSIAD